MNSKCLLLNASWPASPQKNMGLTLPDNELFSLAPLAYPTDETTTSKPSVNTMIPFDESLLPSPLRSPVVTLGTHTSSSNSIAISRSSLSPSTIEKSFDPFDSTYFSNLIPSLTPTQHTTEQHASSLLTNKDAYPRLMTLMTSTPTTHNACGNFFDDMDDKEDATCHDLLSHLIDLDLLDGDHAMDLPSDSETSLAATYSSSTNHLPFPLTSTATPPAYPSYLSASPSSLSSSSLSSTPSTPSLCHAMMTNIWANTCYRYHDPFDDDEFDPTQPLPSTTTSPSLSSSTDSLTSSTYSYQAPLPSSSLSSSTSSSSLTTPPSTSTMAVDMLMALLPHYTRQQVVSTLSSANYDMDHFLVLISSDGRSSVSYTKKRQICRHFLIGDCIRQDCRFAHDISIKVCRFWLQDKCLKGNQCEFAHSMESICIQDQDDFIDHTATRHSKSSRSKKKNKSSQAETKKSDKPWMDAYQDQEHDSSADITIAMKRHRRRQHKKIKRKTSSVSSSSSSSSSSTTVTPNVTPSSTHSGTIHLTTYNNNNNKVRHCDYYEDFPLDEDFPALLSPFTIKSTANPHHPMTLPPQVLALNSISTNFAQVVARNKMKK